MNVIIFHEDVHGVGATNENAPVPAFVLIVKTYIRPEIEDRSYLGFLVVTLRCRLHRCSKLCNAGLGANAAISEVTLSERKLPLSNKFAHIQVS